MGIVWYGLFCEKEKDGSFCFCFFKCCFQYLGNREESWPVPSVSHFCCLAFIPRRKEWGWKQNELFSQTDGVRLGAQAILSQAWETQGNPACLGASRQGDAMVHCQQNDSSKELDQQDTDEKHGRVWGRKPCGD